MRIRYHGWLVLKLLAVTAAVGAVYIVGRITLRQDTFDSILLKFWMLPMVWVALIAFALRDQRFRCRTCARRLRMPVAEGSYGGMLLDHPNTEYVCPYGHGKLRIEAWLSAGADPEWTRSGNMWEELMGTRTVRRR
ncbi:MAG: hypothetical protein H7Y20_08405 [Bryobacteraceae bacterium]|nr:hypothetical protein [Bryobacteraceae bacterium]